MKNKFKFLIFLLITFSFSSCDQAEELLNLTKDFDDTIVETIAINIDKTSGNRATFSSSTILSIDDPALQPYINKIKSVEIKSLSYKIINFSGDANGDVNGEFLIDNIVYLTNAFVVKTEADKGTIFKITEVAALNEIAKQLKANKKLTAKYGGDALCDNDEMEFLVEITADVKIIVSL
jgi:hypothetical protein